MSQWRTKLFIQTIILVLFASPSSNGGERQFRILQFKLDRIYFDGGDEALIRAGSHFRLMLADDTVCTGKIDQSLPGISYSEILDSFSDTISINSCLAWVETADIDSQSVINLKCRYINPPSLLTRIIDNSSAQTQTGSDSIFTEHGNPVSVAGTPIITQVDDFPHGIFSYTGSVALNSNSRNKIATAAPFYVALIPNPSSEANRGGFLTTSLYYRFDERNFDHLFDGEQMLPVVSLIPSADSVARTFEYNPENGRRLLANAPQIPRQIRLSVMNRSLLKLANFFDDILSREKINCIVVIDDPEADLWLTFVPADDNDPTVSLKYLCNLLSGKKPTTKSLEELLAINFGRVEAAEQTDKEEVRLYYCRLADRSLREDIGLFPLFRPRIYFAASELLKNFHFDDNGFLDMNALTLLKPQRLESEQLK